MLEPLQAAHYSLDLVQGLAPAVRSAARSGALAQEALAASRDVASQELRAVVGAGVAAVAHLADAETQLARGVSLLAKLPGLPKLVLNCLLVRACVVWRCEHKP